MKPKQFNELLESVREAGAVMHGERKAHRKTRLSPSSTSKPWMALSGKIRGPRALSTREGFGKR